MMGDGEYLDPAQALLKAFVAQKWSMRWKQIAKQYREELKDSWLYRDCIRRASALYQEQMPNGAIHFPDGAHALARAMLELETLRGELPGRGD
jgi:hypothetical protein